MLKHSSCVERVLADLRSPADFRSNVLKDGGKGRAERGEKVGWGREEGRREEREKGRGMRGG
ncbi:hypothetical protein GCM10010967_34040 [Dyadobacter beijingensis]|uniref:Uncharacterized protein n=1 Tax=Dyadobacter beijingensis TaxID=365489 RepID=A0ABQ2I3B7_9BACT|nr:hypothetical protein GCM10010967_34040 [Dyadobacter beijingensis]